MRFNAWVKYTMTAKVYTWEMNNNGSGRIYRYERDIPIEFDTDPRSPRVTILCEEPLQRYSVLTGIKDRQDNYIMGNTQYQVTVVEPVLNVWHVLEGYKMQAAMTVEAAWGSDYSIDLPIEGGGLSA